MSGIYPECYIITSNGEQKVCRTIELLARSIVKLGLTTGDAVAMRDGTATPLDRHDLGDLEILMREYIEPSHC